MLQATHCNPTFFMLPHMQVWVMQRVDLLSTASSMQCHTELSVGAASCRQALKDGVVL